MVCEFQVSVPLGRLPGAGEGAGGVIFVVVAFPGGEAGAEPVVETVALEDGGRLVVGRHAFHDLRGDALVVVGEAVEVAGVGDEVAGAVVVLEDAHVPLFHDGAVEEERALEGVGAGDGGRGGVGDGGVLVVRVVAVEKQDVFAGLRTFQDLGPLADAAGAEPTVGLRGERDGLEGPGGEIGRGVAGEADEGVAVVLLELAEEVEAIAVAQDARAAGADGAAVLVEPGDAGDDGGRSQGISGSGMQTGGGEEHGGKKPEAAADHGGMEAGETRRPRHPCLVAQGEASAGSLIQAASGSPSRWISAAARPATRRAPSSE